MNKGLLADWFEQAYIRFQAENGRSALDKFADHIGISRGYLSQLLNGFKTTISKKTAVQICENLNDYSLLEILGYSRPEPKSDPFDAFPPEFRELLRIIDLEIEKTLRDRSIKKFSTEAEEVGREVMEKYGFRLSSTTSSGHKSDT